MHIAFAHDHAFYEDAQGDVYSRGGQLGRAILDRYTELFGHVTVLARSQPLAPGETIQGMSKASGPGVSFRLIPEGRGGLHRALGLARRRSVMMPLLSQVDALVARLPSVIGQQACDLARDLALPWGVEVVGSAWHGLVTHGSLLAKVYAPVSHLRARATIARADAVLYVTQAFLQRQYPTSSPSIGVSDVDLPEPDPLTLSARLKRIASKPQPLRVGLIGSVGPSYKGIDTTMLALSSIAARLGPFELCVLGPGDPARYQRLARSLGIESSVRFCGTLPAGAPVRQWLDAMDIYVQPSRTEGLPRSLLEAMSRGCPALGSNVGGIPELLNASCLHSPGDNQGLADRLMETATPDRMSELARHNFGVASDFSAAKLHAKRHAFWLAFADRLFHAHTHQGHRATR